MHVKHKELMPGTEEKLLNVMESNIDAGNADFENGVVAVSLLVNLQWFSTVHRKLPEFLILIIKNLHHFVHPIYLILSATPSDEYSALVRLTSDFYVWLLKHPKQQQLKHSATE